MTRCADRDKQVVGHSPIWSADSNTVAFYSADVTQPGILIYDFIPRVMMMFNCASFRRRTAQWARSRQMANS